MADNNGELLAAFQAILDAVCVSGVDPISGGGGTADRVQALARAKAAGLDDQYVVCELHSTRAMTLPAFIFSHYLLSERDNIRGQHGRDVPHLHSAGSARIAYEGERIAVYEAAREARRRAVTQ